jgi:hypothetical protein
MYNYKRLAAELPFYLKYPKAHEQASRDIEIDFRLHMVERAPYFAIGSVLIVDADTIKIPQGGNRALSMRGARGLAEELQAAAQYLRVFQIAMKHETPVAG